MKKLVGWALFIGLAVMLMMLLNKSNPQHAVIPLSEFVQRLEADKVRWVDVGADELVGEFRGTESVGDIKVAKFRVPLPEGTTHDWDFTRWLLENAHNARVGTDRQSQLVLNIVLPLIPWLLIFAFIWYFVFRLLRQARPLGPREPMPVYIVNPPGPETSPKPPLT
jgi:ATP-dependent Zn protease